MTTAYEMLQAAVEVTLTRSEWDSIATRLLLNATDSNEDSDYADYSMKLYKAIREQVPPHD